jgi:hypothetical protein
MLAMFAWVCPIVAKMLSVVIVVIRVINFVVNYGANIQPLNWYKTILKNFNISLTFAVNN